MAKIPALIFVIVVASYVLSSCEGYQAGRTSWQDQSVLPRSNDQEAREDLPFTVISGWIDDTSDENNEPAEPQVPWRHHVDFDEMHPGEDQIAEETSDLGIQMPQPSLPDQPDIVSLFNPFQPYRFPMMPIPGRRLPTEESERPLSLPSFNVDPDREFAHPLLNMQSLLSLIGNRGPPPVPWYKGSNVCIKREEEDEIVQGEDESSSPTPEPTSASIGVDDDDDLVGYNDLIQQYPKDQPFESIDDTLNNGEAQPEWHMKMSYCQDLDTKRSCQMKLFGPKVKRTITVTYECCHGYDLNDKKEKCERKRYENVAKTIEDIGGSEFLTLLKNGGLLNKVKTENLTVFVPSDDAVASYLTSHAVDSNTIEYLVGPQAARRRRSLIFHRHNNPQGRNVRRHNIEHHNRPNSIHNVQYEDESFETSSEDFDLNDIDWKQNALSQHESHKRNIAYDHEDNQSKLQKTLLSHMIEGKVTTDDFVDEKVIFGENRDSVLRMNTWNIGNEQVKTINCARLTSINHKCSNGIVHMIDRMVKPVSKSIAETIGSDPDLSLLHTLIAASGLSDMLLDRKQNLTFFAPTNAAINKLGHVILHKMQHGDPCLKRILRHHILPLTFCSSIIYKEGQIRNVDHDLLDVIKDADDRLFVNGSEVIVRDIMTTNGVIHVIDTVLISEDDLPISKALEKDGYTKFLSYLQLAGLEDYLDQQNNVTLFVPTNAAMDEIDEVIVSEPSKLREIMLYHIAIPETKTCDFSHDLLMSSKLTDSNIRINMYSHFPIGFDTEVTAQCGRLTRANRMACNGVIHEVDRVLIPSDMNVIETLKIQTDFAIFTRFLIESGLSDKLKQSNSSVTIFAPVDAAFMDLPKDVFQNLLENKENATKMVKNHIVEESLCCSGVAPNNWFMNRRVDCLNGEKVPVYRDATGQVMFGNAKVTTCDLTASNGIVHTVDKVVTSSNDRGELMETCAPNVLGNIRAVFIRL